MTAFAVAVVLVAVAGVLAFGSTRWSARGASLRDALLAARKPIVPATYRASDLDALPAPVQRYFRAVLTDGQRRVAVARLTHVGEFNMSDAAPSWRRFRSSQLVTTRRPGFVWDARIRLAPAVTVYVHDAYVAGEGILRAELLRLFGVASLRGTPEAAAGELMRYLAEAVWYPTALLPGEGLRWDGVDDDTARATLSDGATTVALDYHFDADGLVSRVATNSRWRSVKGAMVPTPWEGRFWSYDTRDGMRIPLEGEVAWVLPDGARPYWRGRVRSARYEWAG